MAKYYTDVMVFNVIRNAMQSPHGFHIADMKRILNAEWLHESLKLISADNCKTHSYKERILRFCMKKRMHRRCFIYYKFR